MQEVSKPNDDRPHPHLGSLSGAGYDDPNAAIFWRYLLGAAVVVAIVAFAIYKVMGGS